MGWKDILEREGNLKDAINKASGRPAPKAQPRTGGERRAERMRKRKQEKKKGNK